MSCLNSFLSVGALRSYMESTNNNQDSSNEQEEILDIPSNRSSYVFPSLQIKESGFIEKWLFAAELVRRSPTGPDPVSIHFQVLRNENEQATVISDINITTPVRSDYPNVYEYQMDPPLLVQAGDYVGIRVKSSSSLRPLWIPDSGTVYHELPLRGRDFNNATIAGAAIPLIAAQISGNTRTNPTSLISTHKRFNHIFFSSILVQVSYSTLEPTTSFTFSASTSPLTLKSSLHISTLYTEPSHTSATRVTETPTVSSSPAGSSELHMTYSASSSSFPLNKNNGGSSNEAIAVTAVVIMLFILLCGVTITLCIVIICIKKRRKTDPEQPSMQNTYSEPQKSRSGFFDNPVYDKLQRKLSKDSQGYSTVQDAIYLELSDDHQASSGTAQDTKHRDSDSGYAELEVKITRASVHIDSAGYSQLIASPSPAESPYPSPRTSPYPSPHTSPHASPRWSPAPSPCPPTRPPLKFHTYHTLETCPLPPEDYIDPRPSATVHSSTESLLQTVTCRDEMIAPTSSGHEYHVLDPNIGTITLRDEIVTPSNQTTSGHEYHELDPNTGVSVLLLSIVNNM